MSAPASTHDQIRRRVLGEAYAFALSVARRESQSDVETQAAVDANALKALHGALTRGVGLSRQGASLAVATVPERGARRSTP